MSLTHPDTIRQAILHPQPAIRRAAVRYFAESYSHDATVMPKVIEAVQRHAVPDNWRLLMIARPLPQTEATLQWAVEESTRPFNAENVAEENYHYALARMIATAPVQLLSEHRQLVEQARLPERPQQTLHERLRLAGLGWEACWAELEELGQQILDVGAWAEQSAQQAELLVEALARRGDGRDRLVLDLVRRQFRRSVRELYEVLDPLFIELAARMRLDRAVPVLTKRLREEKEVGDAALFALSRIGGEAVVRTFAGAWWEADPYTRSGMAEVLGHLRGESAAEAVLAYLDREADEEVWQALARASIRQLNRRVIDRLVPELRGEAEQIERERQELRVRLVEAATIMGVRFDEYDEWYAEAEQMPWAWGGDALSTFRLSEGVEGLVAADDESEEKDLFVDGEQEDPVERLAAGGLGSLAVGPPREGARFPVGTVALYGPDDRTTTKIVAGVITAEGSEPILERWVGTGVADDLRVQQQIRRFLRNHDVQQVVVSDGNMGCPHEEGEDFPVGEDCPFCPYWRGRQ